MLAQFEFRSLTPRVRELFNANGQNKDYVVGDELFAEAAEVVPEDELSKIALAVSVLDSILRSRRSRTSTASDAHAYSRKPSRLSLLK